MICHVVRKCNKLEKSSTRLDTSGWEGDPRGIVQVIEIFHDTK